MITTSAPSNIALIKYMGKEDTSGNIATNPSLSITTEHLTTFVSLANSGSTEDEWAPLEGYPVLDLSSKGKKRYLDFLVKLKNIFGITKPLLLKTANNFPSDAGMASSASSFAALTKAVYLYAIQNTSQDLVHQTLGLGGADDASLALARISRSGSGSSCRSLFSGACIWDQDEIYQYDNIPKTLHLAVVVENEKKKVSSSEAHQRIKTSLLNKGRAERASQRMRELCKAFETGNWEQAYEVCWQEFWDMHTLFETANPHFSFMQASSLEVLRYIENRWQQDGIGPLVTMDAGPNVHLFFRQEDKDLYQTYKTYFSEFHTVIGQI